MTPEAQRTAIAEACGWKKAPDTTGCWHSPEGHLHGWWRERELPDYLNDLNAMAKAQKILNREQRIAYGFSLTTILTDAMRAKGCHSQADFDEHAIWIWEATAVHHAEAFLRTIGKWEEAA